MDFIAFRNRQAAHVKKMLESAPFLYMVDIEKDTIWNTYLKAFPEGTDKMFRERTEHDCSSCRRYVKELGGVVSIGDNNQITTVWDFEAGDPNYQIVIDALAALIRSKPIKDFYSTTPKFAKVGIPENVEIPKEGSHIKWHHMYAVVPNKHLNTTSDSDESVIGRRRDIRNVFERGCREFTKNAIEKVLELISCNAVYRGAEFKSIVEKFFELYREYINIPEKDKANYCWRKSLTVHASIATIRNSAIGTFITDISEGYDEEDAAEAFGKKLDPTNYKRPKAEFTPKMLEAAKAEIISMGYMESLYRRYAAMEDVTINNVIFANSDAARRMKGDVFDDMLKDVALNPKTVAGAREVGIEEFIKNILPGSTNMELFLESRHHNNMVSLIAPKVKDSPSMMKWDNGFSWAYSGNVADSLTKDLVKSFGGDVNGVLRFSIRWNDDGKNNNDFDAHCKQPQGHEEIYFSLKGRRLTSSGMLDVDITQPQHQCNGGPAVENITWNDIKKMPEGKYVFFVHNYSHNGGKSGFSAEIEFDGQIFQFDYNKELKQGAIVNVAEVTYNKTSGFSINSLIPSTSSSKNIWGLPTNQYHPVTIAMLSPNYWDENKGNGNKHYMFMLKGCTNTESPNGFLNEFLKEDLMKHRKVLEALGSKMAVEHVEDQLSGVGFSSTKSTSFSCKVTKSSGTQTFRVTI